MRGIDGSFGVGHDFAPAIWQQWSAPGRTSAEFLPGEQRAAQRAARRLFSRPLEMCEYAALAGAPADAQVDVGAAGGKLYIEMSDPRQTAYHAHYYVLRVHDDIVLKNEGFHVSLRSLQRRGFGLRCFRRQVIAAAGLGVDRIELVAGRGPRENGYYTWPRFGFDGILPEVLRNKLPHELDGAQTLLDLMQNEMGRAWWREHGETISVAFDLSRGSRSRAALDRYVRQRHNRMVGPKRNLENARSMP